MAMCIKYISYGFFLNMSNEISLKHLSVAEALHAEAMGTDRCALLR